MVVLQSLQYFHYPKQFGVLRSGYLKSAVRYSVRRAEATITVTDWEQSEAIRLLGLDPNKATTVYHGVSDAVVRAAAGTTAPAPAFVGQDPYILMVSTLYGFKNHHRLLQAFSRVVETYGVPHRLVVVGQDADVTREELHEQAARLGIGDRVLLPGGLPHDDIPALIANADAIAYPSLYETFGLPVLEALAFGRPLVTSASGATGEVAADAACLVDPTDVEQLANGIAEVLLNDHLRSQLASLGPARAATFTWTRCAEETAAVLREAIGLHRAPQPPDHQVGPARSAPWATDY